MNPEEVKQEKVRLNKRKELLKQQKSRTISSIKKSELDLKKKELRLKEKEIMENKYICSYKSYVSKLLN